MENRILRDQIANHFNRDELIVLCFDIEIDHESFPENLSKARLVQEIISYCQRHGKTDELLNYCKTSRPKIDWSLQHLAKTEQGKVEHSPATHILKNIVPAGPIQPDGGLMPSSINAVKDLINYWNNEGRLSLLVNVVFWKTEKRETFISGLDHAYLSAEQSMHQVWVSTSDIDHKITGMVQSPANIGEQDYHKALAFFLVQMGLLKNDNLKVKVSHIANLDDSFLIHIQ